MSTQQTLTQVLRMAILDCGQPLVALERATGVDRASIRRFIRGQRSLRLDKADLLARHLQLELRKKGA